MDQIIEKSNPKKILIGPYFIIGSILLLIYSCVSIYACIVDIVDPINSWDYLPYPSLLIIALITFYLGFAIYIVALVLTQTQNIGHRKKALSNMITIFMLIVTLFTEFFVTYSGAFVQSELPGMIIIVVLYGLWKGITMMLISYLLKTTIPSYKIKVLNFYGWSFLLYGIIFIIIKTLAINQSNYALYNNSFKIISGGIIIETILLAITCVLLIVKANKKRYLEISIPLESKPSNNYE